MAIDRWRSLSPGASVVSVHQSVHPGMGANLAGDECSFRVWAPNAIGDRSNLVRADLKQIDNNKTLKPAS
jgi:hypothetical protein